jgi:membrane associated rhomboid family serine protease
MFPLFDENEPGQGIAWVTLALIAINVAVFLLIQQAGADNQFTYGFSTIPLEITTGRDIIDPQPVIIDGVKYLIPEAPGPNPIYLTLLTSMFMHGGWLHLGGNMLFLFIFGDNVEHYLGSLLYLAFYLVAGIVASFAQILVDPTSAVPNLGASGAISGVLGAYIVLFPRNRVVVFLFRFLVPVPAIVAIGLWAVLQFVSGIGSIAVTAQTGGGGVAYLAHVGGFITGLVVGFLARSLFGDPAARRRLVGR